MSLQNPTTKLSSQDYWDEVLKSAKLPRLNTADTYLYRITMRFIDPYIRKAGYQTLFEVGCGSSGWLPYFAKQYDLLVSGLDYSDVGCVLARKNLELQGIEFGEVLCKDLFEPECTGGKRYDIIFSYGVVEHFEAPEKVIGIFDTFLKPGGIMITLVPNFMGLAGKLTKVFMPDVYAIHNLISAKELASMHTSNELQTLKCSYAGIFSLFVMPWQKSSHWLFKNGTVRRKVLLFLLKGMEKVMTGLFKLLPFDMPSRLFSPYVICVARKK
jgi:2-polyprenyl-3-methyl-5-hydroxy-6-metoxy-1,4-benzoquinol methylase